MLRLAYFLMFSQVAVSVQYLQVYLRTLGFGNAQIGLLMGLFQISGVLGTFIAGAIIDRRPVTRLLLAVAIGGSMLLFVSLGAASTLYAAIPVMVALGLLMRSEVPLLDTHVSLVLHRTREDYGPLRVWGSIGFVLLSLVFQFAGCPRPTIPGSIVVTFVVVSGAYLVAVFVLPRAAGSKEQETRAAPGALPPAYWLFLTIVFLSNMGFASHSAFFSLFVQDMLPGFLVSGAWAIGAIAEIPFVFYGGALLRRLGVRSMLVLAAAGTCVRLALYAAFPETAVVLGAQLLHAFTFGALHIAGMGFISGTVAARSRGRAVSLYSALGYGVPGLIGGVAGGQILESFGFGALFAAFAVPPAIGAILALVGGRALSETAPAE